MAARILRGLIGAIALFAVACVQNDGSRNPLKQITEVNVSDERRIGAQVDAQLREHLPLIDDLAVLAFMNELGQSLVRPLGPQPFLYRFRVLREPSLNAFALPGGYLYFQTGTILAAGSLDELVGVMAHEIAHAKRRHIARMEEEAAVPGLLARILGIGVAVATNEPGAVLVGEAINQSVRLAYTRELEAEADVVGTAFMVRAGYDPHGMAVFFERLLAGRRDPGFAIPPYLNSHPRVESRIDAAVDRARTTSIPGREDPHLRANFRAIQLRVAILVENDRASLAPGLPSPDPAVSGPALDEAARLAKADQLQQAVAVLASAENREPNDPRLAFRRGELLREAGQTRDALDAYRKAVDLDPSVGLTHFRIGSAYLELDDPVSAMFYLEQAERRFERGGALQKRAERLIHRLTFPVVAESGIDSEFSGDGTGGATAREEFPPGTSRLVWWARIEPEWAAMRDRIQVRWLDPSGRVVQDEPAVDARRPWASSTLDLDASMASRFGIWQLEATLEGARVERRTFRLVPGS